MNYFLVIILILALFDQVFAACDYVEKLKQCYEPYLEKTLDSVSDFGKNKDLTISMLSEPFCERYNEMKDCLGEYQKDCLNLDIFGKIFGINSAAVVLLMHDSMLEHWCVHKFNITEDNKKCDKEVTEKCTRGDFKSAEGCKMFKEYLECMKTTMTENCDDKKFVKHRLDAEQFAAKKTLPFCKV